jgi:hypothetical protein
MKTEALKLADELDALHQYVPSEAPAMIRRLVDELDRNKIYIQKMEDALGCDVSYYEPLNKPVNPFAWVDEIGVFVTNEDYKELHEKLKEGMIPLYTTPQTKPLSDEEIQKIADDVCYLIDKDKKGRSKGAMYIEDFARAIEERHGIK